MQRKNLAALLSSLISQVLLLLLQLFPSSTTDPLSLASSSHSSDTCNYNRTLFHLIHHFLSSQETAASMFLLPKSRKRKRTHLSERDSELTHEISVHELGHRLRELHRVAHSLDSFKTIFKMRSSTFEWLASLLEPLLDCRDPIGFPLNLSAELRLGIGLFRLATGSVYSEIADRFGVPEPVCRFCAKQLSRVLCTNFRFWVSIPSPVELEAVSKDIETLTGLPNCCGVIDCARFKFVNRTNSQSLPDSKFQDDSIAVQIVADSSSRILSIVAGFRGYKDDVRILKSTTLYKDIGDGRLLNSSPVYLGETAVNQYLIGDRDYPLLPWLMVPFVDVMPGSCEEKFNVANSLMCASALTTISSLRNWGVLSKPIEEEFRTAVASIGACSILHNALLIREDDSALFCLENCLLSDQDSEHDRDAIVEENLTESSKASEIRSTLAARVAESHSS